MQAVHGDKCVDASTVRRLVREFKQEEVGEAGLCDKARSGRPLNCTQKNVVANNVMLQLSSCSQG